MTASPQPFRTLLAEYQEYLDDVARIDREEPYSRRAQHDLDDTALSLLHKFAKTAGALDAGVAELLTLSGPVWSAVQQLGTVTGGLLTALVGVAADEACTGTDSDTARPGPATRPYAAPHPHGPICGTVDVAELEDGIFCACARSAGGGA